MAISILLNCPKSRLGGCRLLDVDHAESPAQAKRFAEANSDTLREHFYDMTAALLVPFAPYCQPSLPEDATSLGAGPAPLPVFEPSTFLEALPFNNVPRGIYKRLGSQVSASFASGVDLCGCRLVGELQTSPYCKLVQTCIRLSKGRKSVALPEHASPCALALSTYLP